MTARMSQSSKLVYRFDEGDASMTGLLGGKGSNLCEMVRMGLPVPPGFVISTEACLEYFKLRNQLPEGLTDSIRENIFNLEKAMDRRFASSQRPLLVSVRSGARVSMPGMMDTILNLGTLRLGCARPLPGRAGSHGRSLAERLRSRRASPPVPGDLSVLPQNIWRASLHEVRP